MSVVLSLYEYIWDSFISKVPSHIVRYLYIKIINKSITRSTTILLNVRFKGIRKIKFSKKLVINSFSLLDGRGGLIVGENVDVAERVVIWSMTHDVKSSDHATKKTETEIGDYVWIGSDSIILAGLKIGEGAVIGAGSVVTKNVAPLDIVAGNPAVIVGKRQILPKYIIDHKPIFK
jgi:acetyltransferase-like isoleucine patch superfamily enzyme